MKTIIIEDEVYSVSNSQYSKIKEFEKSNLDDNGFELRMSDFLENNKKKYKYIGNIDYMFRI